MASELKIGSVFNFIGIAVRLVVGFTMTPYMLACLGENNFGLFSLAGGILAYLVLMDFGLSPTVTRFVAEYAANRQIGKEMNLIGQSVYLFVLLGLLLGIVGWVLYYYLGDIYGEQLTAGEFADLQWMYIIMVANTALFFPSRAFTGVLSAHQKFKVPGYMGLANSIVTVALTFLLLYLGYGPVALVLGTAIVNSIYAVWTVVYAMSVLDSPLVLPRPDFSVFRSMTKYALGIFVPQICEVINWQLAPVVLGMVAGLSAVAVYRVGWQIPSIFMSLPFAISGVFLSKIVGMVTQGTPVDVLVRLMARVGRVQSFLIFICLIGFTLFGLEFLTLWVHELSSEQIADAWWISMILMYSTTWPLLMTLSGPIVQAYMLNYRRMFIILAIMPVTFAVGIYLSAHLQGIGFALATGVVSAVLGTVLSNRLILRNCLHFNMLDFYKQLFHKIWIPLGATIATGIFLRWLTAGQEPTWALFAVKCALIAGIYFLLMWRLWANEEEKEMLLGALRRLIPRSSTIHP